jgi:mRNA interferase RelE/StbE
MTYRVIVTPAADRAVAKLPGQIRERIAERLRALADNPRPVGSIKLAGEDLYRIRVGDYRIIYSIEDDRLVILVVDVGHRREIYRRR